VGLPPHVTEEILRIFLEDMGAHIDTTTIILDKETGLSKRFGFAKFASQEHARAFVEPNFPTIAWKDPPGSVSTGFDGVRLKVDPFELASTRFHVFAKIDFSQTEKALPRSDNRASGSRAAAAAPVNDGMKHIAQRPTRFLLLRGLDPVTTETEIANILHGLLSRRATPHNIQRVLLAKDRRNHTSWGFAFIEFLDQKVHSHESKSARLIWLDYRRRPRR
jgi:RNA-binding protein 5/10